MAEDADSGERTIFSSKFACPESGFTIEEIKDASTSHDVASRIIFGSSVHEQFGVVDMMVPEIQKKYQTHVASTEAPYVNISQSEFALYFFIPSLSFQLQCTFYHQVSMFNHCISLSRKNISDIVLSAFSIHSLVQVLSFGCHAILPMK